MHPMPAALTLLARTRRRVRSLSDALLLARVVAVMLLLPLIVRLPTMTMLRWLERWSRVFGVSPEEQGDVLRFVRACGGLHWGAFQDNCVAQSLTLFALLNRVDAPLDVAFGVAVHGVAEGAPQLGRRHVWLERDGAPVFERDTPAPYAVQMRYRDRLPGDTGRRDAWPLLRTLGVSSVGTALSSLASLARTKLVAVTLGTAGVAIAGQVSQSMFALTWLATFGTSAGTTRYLSEALSRDDQPRAALVVRTAAALLAAAAALLVAAGLLAAPHAAAWLFGSPAAVRWVWWLLPAVPAAALMSLSTALLRGEGQAQRLALGQAAGACAAIGATYLLLRGGTVDRLSPLALVMTATQAAALTVAAWPLVRRWGFAAHPFRLDGALARAIATYGAANVIMGVATATSTLVVGRTYLAAGMTTEAGYIAALAWFAEPLASVFVSGLHASTYPAYCAAGRTDASAVLSRAVRALVLFTVPVLFVGTLAAGPLLDLLFSRMFAGLAPLLEVQLFATYLRCANILLGMPLLARGRIAWLAALHVLWTAAAAWGAVYGLAGSQAYVLALVSASLGQAVLLGLLLRAGGLAPSRRDYAWLAGGAAVLLLAVML